MINILEERLKRNTKLNLLKVAFVLVVITIMSNIFAGYRFIPESAVRAVRFYPEERPVILLSERMNPNCVFYLVDAGEQYHTVYCKKTNFLWRAYVGWSSQEKTESGVELLNKFWVGEDVNAGWVVSISHDPKVKSIKIRSGDTVIQRETLLGQPVVIQIKTNNRSDMDVKFEGVALSSSDEVLYRLDYEINGNVIEMGKYGWISEKGQ